MHPEALLGITGQLLGFLLKSSLAFGICWVLSKIVVSPSGRFFVWLAFLVGSGCYWLSLIGAFLPHPAVLTSMPTAFAQAAPVAKLQIDTSYQTFLWLLLRAFGWAYLAALAYFLFTRIRSQVHLRWVLRFAYSAPDEIEAVFRRIARGHHAGNARLMVLSGIHSPGTFGWLNPTVLLPPFCTQRQPDELEIILRHELQHIRRRDFALTSIASLCRALLFFHPVMWFAMRKLRLETEVACDLAVAGESAERRATYAECLVRFARSDMATEPQPWNLDFASASTVQLQARISSVLSETAKAPRWLIGLRVAAGLGLLVGFIGLVPSLFISLSYEQGHILQKLGPVLLASHTEIKQGKRSGHAIYATRFLAPQPVANVSEEVPRDASPVETAGLRTTPRGSEAILVDATGPTLKRRSVSGEGAAQRSDAATTIGISGESPEYSGGQGAGHRTIDSVLTTANDISQIAHGGKDSR